MILNRRRRSRPRRKGVTFLEILIVMLIIALTAGIVGVNLLGEADKAKVDATKIQIRSVESALDLYRLHNSGYPTSDQGLGALLSQPSVGSIPQDWRGPYIKPTVMPLDGWGKEFRYTSDGSSYTITSMGKDGVEGGTDLNADISNAGS